LEQNRGLQQEDVVMLLKEYGDWNKSFHKVHKGVVKEGKVSLEQTNLMIVRG